MQRNDFKTKCLKAEMLSFCIIAAILLLSQHLVTAQSPETVLQDPGVILIAHGYSYGVSDCSAGTCAPIEFDEDYVVPPWAKKGTMQATVFLNGWYGEYISPGVYGGHNVGQLNIRIKDVQLKGDHLKWKAIGQLAQANQDNPYILNYNYTIIVWNRSEIDANPYFEYKVGCDKFNQNCIGNLNWEQKKSTSNMPLLILPSYLEIKGGYGNSAILPMGFDFAELPYGDADSNLLQIAYDMGHTENIIEYPKKYGHLKAPSLPSKASRIDSSSISWESEAILKDNNDVLDYSFWEYLTALYGNDVDIIQPPFSINPQLEGNYIGYESYEHGIETEERIIENVPFEYAAPVLAGWNLKYTDQDDENVMEIGVWLHDIHYEKGKNDLSGTLRYKISYVLKDLDGEPPYEFGHKINILGIKGINHYPDLTLVPPYCSKANDKQLAIRIRNQGKVDAKETITNIKFTPGGSIDIPTPKIAPGGDVIITAIIPTSPINCFDSDCDFQVLVDSNQDIKESDEYNNKDYGKCVG